MSLETGLSVLRESNDECLKFWVRWNCSTEKVHSCGQTRNVNLIKVERMGNDRCTKSTIGCWRSIRSSVWNIFPWDVGENEVCWIEVKKWFD